MRRHQLAIGGIFAALLAAAIVAGCGGGASSALPGGGGGGGNPSPTPTVSPSPTPSTSPSPGSSATPVILGAANIAVGGSWPNPTEAPDKHAEVDVTCGCSAQAGTVMSDGSGNFTIQTAVTAVPPSPNPQYTLVPGRNYMVIATNTAASGNKAQGWTIIFAGNDSTRNQFLNPGVNVSDTITAAVALWVYGNSTANAEAFDDWNFVTLQGFYQHLATAPTTQETQLLSDIVSQQIAGKTIYPSKPNWRPNRIKNPIIQADVQAINTSTDPSVPTPCPGGPGSCTGTPTP